MKKILLLIATCAVFLSSASATTPINIIVGYQAGGGFDIIARKFAKFAESELNTNVIVNNVVGAGGAIALAKLDSSPATTLMFTGSVHHVLLTATNTPVNKYKYPGIFGESYFYLGTSKKHGLTCEALRDKSSKFFIGTNGLGTATSAAASMIVNKNPGITEVPYKGEAASQVDLIGNQIQLVVLSRFISNQPEINVIANTSPNSLGEIPSWKECLGVEGMMRNQYMLVTTLEASDEYVIKINQVMNKFVKDPETIKYFKESGIIPRSANYDTANKLVTTEHKVWDKK
jgi:tripartite-type tricarboxylate transporter receptor subunit TctC